MTPKNLMYLNFLLKHTAIPPLPELKPRPRTVNTNRGHFERLQELAMGNRLVLRQRVVHFGHSWFEMFTYQGRNNKMELFVDQVR